MGRLARCIVIAATSTRDAQPEWLKCFFGAYAHRGVRDIGPWINLPPLAILAHPPVGCGHCRLPIVEYASTRHERQGQARVRPCVRPSGPRGPAVPSGRSYHCHREAISIPPLSPHPSRRVWDGARADDAAGGGAQGQAGAAIPQLKMKGSPAITINVRRSTHQVTMEKRVTKSDTAGEVGNQPGSTLSARPTRWVADSSTPAMVTSLSVSKVRMTQVRAHAPCAPPSGRRWSRRLDHPAPVSVA
jgi:hypothetical protein